MLLFSSHSQIYTAISLHILQLVYTFIGKMHFSATTFFALASLAIQSSLALVVPKDIQSTDNTLSSRAPHFFQLREPAPDYTLYSPNPAAAGAYSSFDFKALDGEQSSEYHVKVYLESSSGDKTEVSLYFLLVSAYESML